VCVKFRLPLREEFRLVLGEEGAEGGIGPRREGRSEKEDTEVYDEDFLGVLSCKYRLGDQIEEDK
jgi:hypothetical protein